MDYLVILYGVLIGIFVALVEFGAGKLGQTGDVVFNYVKGLLLAIVGGIFGAWIAYTGGTLNPDAIMLVFSSLTFGGIGVVWIVDMITQMIVSYLEPKSSLGKSMALARK